MATPDENRWGQLWQGSGAKGDARQAFHELCAQYASPPRAYHNLTHISECLEEFDNTRHLATNPFAIEFAIWFHDAIYDSMAKDNEERSAELAQNVLRMAELSEAFVDTVRQLILATKHNQPPKDAGTALLIDIDLSILGQPAEKFDRYEKGIRHEYSWVSAKDFAAGRTAVLKSFLGREKIYSTDFFQQKYEIRARENLKHSIELLKSQGL